MNKQDKPHTPWNAPQWNASAPPPPQNPHMAFPAQPIASRRKRSRWFMWAFLAVQLLFLVWVIMGISSGTGSPDDCGTLDAQTCNDAESAGTALGVGLVIVLWALVDIILGITYAVIRIARRP
ncbi:MULTISPECIES: hypothetical protein [unclassified Streptomyces]|uniref:hypothetical protein n=1 Tax=Streptomyces sp. SYP-A7185 TaxID=3040076 RepID=UPI0038F687FC